MDAVRSRIPFVDLYAGNSSVEDEIFEAWRRIFRESSFIGGAEVDAFGAELAAAVGVPHGIGVGNGTDALQIAYEALGVGRGDEVITVPHTFVATAAAASRLGATPVFVDVDRATATLDPARLEAAITPRTRAIAPVHLYGQPAEMEPILEIAGRHGIPVLEDTAQAQGASYRGRAVGALGAIATFSFYPGKNLGAFGDAGAVATADDALAATARLLRDHGQPEKYVHALIGSNSRLDAMQAAALRVKLRRLDGWNDDRRRVAARYATGLAGSGLELPTEAEGRRHVWHLYVVRHHRRDALREALDRAGVSTGLHYPTPLHLQPAYAALGHRAGAFPEAERWARYGLSLPIFPGMTDDQIDRVCAAIAELGLEPCEGAA